jgi:enoyl-CoA hydratase/carnithine racemase
MSEVVRYVVQHEVDAAIITLDRPSVRNALDMQMYRELAAAIERAADDDDVRSVIVTGAGDRAFSAGADLDELTERTHLSEVGPLSALRRQTTARLENMPKPTIAAMNGHAIGGGLEIAVACTFRLLVPQARVGFGEINLGIIPGNGGTQRTVRLVGLARTLELVLTGEPVSAAEAERIGLVHRVVPPEELMSEAFALAARLASKSPLALAAAKEAIVTAGDVPLAAGLALENKWFAIVNGGPDKAEAIAAFREKRTPRFE